MYRKIGIVLAAALSVAAPIAAQNVDNVESYEWLMRQPVPVTTGDITDRPYRVVGQITKGVHKFTIFSRDPSYEKVMRELWESARRMNADAVIHAQFGEASERGFVKGRREARGTAIRFLQGAELEEWRARHASQ